MAEKLSTDPCCETMRNTLADADQPGNYDWSVTVEDTYNIAGQHDQPIVFCPWCGKELPKGKGGHE